MLEMQFQKARYQLEGKESSYEMFHCGFPVSLLFCDPYIVRSAEPLSLSQDVEGDQEEGGGLHNRTLFSTLWASLRKQDCGILAQTSGIYFNYPLATPRQTSSTNKSPFLQVRT